MNIGDHGGLRLVQCRHGKQENDAKGLEMVETLHGTPDLDRPVGPAVANIHLMQLLPGWARDLPEPEGIEEPAGLSPAGSVGVWDQGANPGLRPR
jgi:hypothetical protein